MEKFTPPLKTWTEIKLRNIDEKLTVDLNHIMKQLHERSATKAIEYLIRNYSSEKQRLLDLRAKIDQHQATIHKYKEKLADAEFKLLQVKNTYISFTKLLDGIEDLPKEEIEVEDTSEKCTYERDWGSTSNSCKKCGQPKYMHGI